MRSLLLALLLTASSALGQESLPAEPESPEPTRAELDLGHALAAESNLGTPIVAFEVLGVEPLSWRPQGLSIGDVGAPDPIPLLRCRVHDGLLGDLGPGDEFLVRYEQGHGWDLDLGQLAASHLHRAALSWDHGIEGVNGRTTERLERLVGERPVLGLGGRALPLVDAKGGRIAPGRGAEVWGRAGPWRGRMCDVAWRPGRSSIFRASS